MFNKNNNKGADNARKISIKVPKVKKAKKAVEEPVTPTAKEMADYYYLKAVHASLATAQAEANKAKRNQSANNADSELAAAVEASLASQLQEGIRNQAHVDSAVENRVERLRQAGSPSGLDAEATFAKARNATPPPITPQVIQPATKTWLDLLREQRPVIEPISAVRQAGGDRPLQVSKPAEKSGSDVQAAAPASWASVVKAGRPVVEASCARGPLENVAQAGPKPAVEVKQTSMEDLLERIQQLQAELKDTSKAKEAVEQCVVKAEAAAHAARIEMQTLQEEREVSKALAAEAERSHAADFEKWKGELDDASHDIATHLTEVENQSISYKEETARLRATLQDKEALLERWAANDLELRDRQQALEAQLQRNQEESARLRDEAERAKLGREARNTTFRRLCRKVYESNNDAKASRAELEEHKRVNAEVNAALRALQQQQVGEALRHAKEGVKRSHTHRVAIMSQLLRLRRSGAVSDPRMAMLLEDFAIFQREHRLYTGEVRRLEALRDGGSGRAVEGDNAGGGGGGDNSAVSSSIGGIGGGGGDDVSSGGGRHQQWWW